METSQQLMLRYTKMRGREMVLNLFFFWSRTSTDCVLYQSARLIACRRCAALRRERVSALRSPSRCPSHLSVYLVIKCFFSKAQRYLLCWFHFICSNMTLLIFKISKKNWTWKSFSNDFRFKAKFEISGGFEEETATSKGHTLGYGIFHFPSLSWACR